MEWEFLEERWPRFGCVLYVSAKDDYIQYPTGMGGRLFIEKAIFEEWATHLAELGTDFMAPKDGKEVLQSRFMGERLMSVLIPHHLQITWEMIGPSGREVSFFMSTLMDHEQLIAR